MPRRCMGGGARPMHGLCRNSCDSCMGTAACTLQDEGPGAATGGVLCCSATEEAGLLLMAVGKTQLVAWRMHAVVM